MLNENRSMSCLFCYSHLFADVPKELCQMCSNEILNILSTNPRFVYIHIHNMWQVLFGKIRFIRYSPIPFAYQLRESTVNRTKRN